VTEVIVHHSGTTELALQRAPARALEADRPRDDAQGVAAGAQVGDERMEMVQGERASAPPFADRRDERVVVTKTGHASHFAAGGKVPCGAAFKGHLGARRPQ
jgi:hypothetical protein